MRPTAVSAAVFVNKQFSEALPVRPARTRKRKSAAGLLYLWRKANDTRDAHWQRNLPKNKTNKYFVVKFDDGAIATAEANFFAVYGYDVRAEVFAIALASIESYKNRSAVPLVRLDFDVGQRVSQR